MTPDSPGDAVVVATPIPRMSAGEEASAPTLTDAVQAPLVRLIDEYTSAMETMRRVLAALGPIASVSLPDAVAPATPLPTPPAMSAVGVEVNGGNRDALIDFEDALSQLPGVERVALKDYGDGRASFAVTLSAPSPGHEDDPGFSVVCAWCGRLLTLGGVRISHGLCPECAAAASAGRAVRDGADQPAGVASEKMLLYLHLTPRGWIGRRSDGAGDWVEIKTGCPAEMPAHRALQQVSAEYPDMLVVVSGDGVTPARNGSRAKSVAG